MSAEVPALRAELAALRGRVRLLTLLTGAAVVVALAAMLRASPSESNPRRVELEAQEYRLVDPDGRLRGMFRCPPAGPSLEILDERGRPIIVLSESPLGGGQVRIMDADGRFQMK
jgi:hypothetical protein